MVKLLQQSLQLRELVLFLMNHASEVTAVYSNESIEVRLKTGLLICHYTFPLLSIHCLHGAKDGPCAFPCHASARVLNHSTINHQLASLFKGGGIKTEIHLYSLLCLIFFLNMKSKPFFSKIDFSEFLKIITIILGITYIQRKRIQT